MGNDKRYYWLKLKEEFMNGQVVRYLMRQQHGLEYFMIYLKLCTSTINTGGELAIKLDEISLPYTDDEICRICEFFDKALVAEAIQVLTAIHLIVKQDNGILKIADFDSMVGSETKWAKKKRKTRENENKRKQEEGGHSGGQFPPKYVSVSSSVSNSSSNSSSINEWELHEDDDIPF